MQVPSSQAHARPTPPPAEGSQHLQGESHSEYGGSKSGGPHGVSVCVRGTGWFPHSLGNSANGYSTRKAHHRYPDQSGSLNLDALGPGPFAHVSPPFLLQTPRLSSQASLPPTPICRQGLWRVGSPQVPLIYVQPTGPASVAFTPKASAQTLQSAIPEVTK